MHWFALTVKPRHEKAVAEHLMARSIESYSPVYRERRRWSDRIRTVELPLFPRYVFCRFSFAERLKVISMPSVQSVVGFGGEPTPVEDREIDAVKTLVGSGLEVAPWHYLRVGQRVRICQGPLSGLEGILTREKSGYRVVINVELLQRAVAVEIDRNFVGTIDGAQPASASSS
ncbi:MAG: UpxY family transcription antiterminator [Bryobacteraceae bacterium]|jgi:transcription antitermination factor NusG